MIKGADLKVIPLHLDTEDENIKFYNITFLSISSYGKADFMEFRNGTLFVSDGIEYFTPIDRVTFERVLQETIFRNQLIDHLIRPNFLN